MTDRMLRGGLARLVLYRTDTGASIDVPAVLVPARDGAGTLDEQPEQATTAAGTTRTIGWDRSIRAVISDQLVVERLKTWERDGALIRAVSVGMRESAHRLWYESVRVDLRAADAAYGGLAGHLLTLRTAKYSADVALSDDLNALASWRDTTGDGVADDYALVVTGGDGLAAPAFTGAGSYRLAVAHGSGGRGRLLLPRRGAPGAGPPRPPLDAPHRRGLRRLPPRRPRRRRERDRAAPGLLVRPRALARRRARPRAARRHRGVRHGRGRGERVAHAAAEDLHRADDGDGEAVGRPGSARSACASRTSSRAPSRPRACSTGASSTGARAPTRCLTSRRFGTATDEEAATTRDVPRHHLRLATSTLGPGPLLDVIASRSADPAKPHIARPRHPRPLLTPAPHA